MQPAPTLKRNVWLPALLARKAMLRSVSVLFVLAASQPISAAGAQAHRPGFGLELHVGYGGGGLHRDHLVGGGIGYRFGAHLEMTGFLTAVVARPGGRAVFGGLAPRVFPTGGTVRPYVTAGPLLALRAYTRNRIGEFAGGGVEVVLDRSNGYWRVFVEGRAMHGGGSWGQVVGGVRYR
jgi:hypothetical protein